MIDLQRPRLDEFRRWLVQESPASRGTSAMILRRSRCLPFSSTTSIGATALCRHAPETSRHGTASCATRAASHFDRPSMRSRSASRPARTSCLSFRRTLLDTAMFGRRQARTASGTASNGATRTSAQRLALLRAQRKALPASSRYGIITGHRDSRATSSRGSRPYGAKARGLAHPQVSGERVKREIAQMVPGERQGALRDGC
jgi:hypothetical protein